MKKTVVLGGGGYLGYRLGCAALQAGYDEVLLLDIHPPDLGALLPTQHVCSREAPVTPELPKGVSFLLADVRDEARLNMLFSDAAVVFHTASHGMSGIAQLERRRVEEINVRGTQAVIKACVCAGVERLIYTSTCNTVFGGQRIHDGDESLPLFPIHRHVDCYSRTKAQAEMEVLAADMTLLPPRKWKDRQQLQQRQSQRPQRRYLRTSAIRATGIWGPGEQRHLPRVAQYTEAGLFRFTFGSADALADFVHIDNLVQAHLLAAEGLTSAKRYVAGGQPYFISDGRPINNFAFFGQLVEGLGYPLPTLRLPLWLVFAAAFLLEILFAAIGYWWDFSLHFMLTRAEVLKAGQHHFFSIEKARRELGYCPDAYSFQPVVDWFLERGHGTVHAQAQWAARRGLGQHNATAPTAQADVCGLTYGR